MTLPITRYSALLGLSALMAAGGQAQKPTSKPPTTRPVEVNPPVVRRQMTNAELQKASTVESFINGLPSWEKPPKDYTHKSKPVKEKNEVVRTDYSLATTPQEIVTFEPVNAFWVGALIQETGMRAGRGSLREIAVPADKRAPFKLTTDLLNGKNVKTISQPSSSSVQQSLGDIIQSAKGLKFGSSIDYKMTENHSAEQAALSLGLDVHYMGGKLSASLDSSRKEESHSVSAMFVEKAFTAKADFEGRSGAAAYFNANFKPEDAHKLVKNGSIRTDNRPCYVSSITYGRMMIFTLTSKASKESLEGTVQAMYNAGFAGGELNASAKKVLSSSSTEIRVTSIGGPAEATTDLIRTGKLADFFSKSAPLSSMVPISYTVNTVREQMLASMQRSTEYSIYDYPPAKPTGMRYKISMWIELLDAKDKGGSGDSDIYGEMRINGEVVWPAPGDKKTIYRTTGESIDLLKAVTYDYFYDKKNKWEVKCWLKEDDNIKDDDMGKFNFTLDPFALLPSGNAITKTVSNQDSRSKNDGNSKLFVRIERIGPIDK